MYQIGLLIGIVILKQNWSHTDDLFYPNSMKMLVCAMV